MPPEDDARISGDVVLLRRIPPWAGMVVWEVDNSPIPSSQNFRDAENDFSTFILAETTVEAVLEGHDGFGLIRFKAQAARECLGVGFIFFRDEPPLAHVVIRGPFTNGVSRRFKRDSRWEWELWPARYPPGAVPPSISPAK
jgi:hypothetical protein